MHLYEQVVTTLLHENGSPNKVIKSLQNYHMQWLQLYISQKCKQRVSQALKQMKIYLDNSSKIFFTNVNSFTRVMRPLQDDDMQLFRTAI